MSGFEFLEGISMGGVGAFALVIALCWGSTPAVTPPQPNTVVSPRLQETLQLHPSEAQRVWVMFADKQIHSDADRDRALRDRTQHLSPRAIQRRQLRRSSPGIVDERDLDVPTNYIASVTAFGVALHHTSRWLNAISITASSEQIAQIATLPFVKRIQLVARAVRTLPVPIANDQGAEPRGVPTFHGESTEQLTQIDIIAAHNAGYTGSGVIIGILDTGFNRTHISFNQTTGGAHPVQIIAEHDFVDDDGVTSQQPGDTSGQSNHGTYILGTIGAYHPTVLVGAAYNASFLLAKTENIAIEVPAEEDDYVAGLEWLESLGADLATSSLGYSDWYTQADFDGETAVTTIGVNIATDNGMPCCTAAGNGGNDSNPSTSHLGAPADAFEVLTCGAVDSSGGIASFSSDGPTADGRVKPEVLARGVNTRTVSATDDTTVSGVNGTSLSTPLLAGGVALIVQAHPNWTVDKIRRALFHTSTGFFSSATYDGTYVRGYGIIDIMAAINFVHSDVNGDGVADGRDIATFTTALLGSNPNPNQNRRADINASGAVDVNDIPVFVLDLLAQ